jgi:hypothetical protein
MLGDGFFFINCALSVIGLIEKALIWDAGYRGLQRKNRGRRNWLIHDSQRGADGHEGERDRLGSERGGERREEKSI